ncbi:MAG: RNA polymerase-associated protein RapA [Nitrosomonas sp.]|nr:MAG: RNA polymerase-associated protein RapA [Nitrosomonas sp.]
MNDEFKPGQRWLCDVDLQLGLGVVETVEYRIVRISFKVAGETRSYAKHSAPLTRVIFKIGDIVSSQQGVSIEITQVHQSDGLVTYAGTSQAGETVSLTEAQLAHHLQLNRPSERLLTGQFDHDKWFRIRYQTWLMRDRLANTPLYGLIGTRTSLIPHQLYIAHEVAHRYAPRVLLADEVGLGKTIEAGMILHQQLLTERARRVLIVVPETLIHQWLVEMLRRFNLQFSIFDEQRCLSLEESEPGENPFLTEQLVLCGLHFLKQYPNRFQAALNGNWDLLVVDEVHHLEWSEQSASPEYAMIEQLAARTEGVLLLTATPEQLGKASHFARLRLLDPNRFDSFVRFVAEEQLYEPIAKAIEALLEGRESDETVRQTVLATLGTAQSLELLENIHLPAARSMLAELLLDRHGTGRILFRNTRAAVQGFPERMLNPVALPLPEHYQTCLQTFEAAALSKPQLLLCPELLYQVRAEDGAPYWTDIDPRIDWLSATLKQLRPEKVLIIAASAQSARDIAQALKLKVGQYIPVFHENLSLIERDRAAAFFADEDSGCQALVCSEIGSEGRNFQFAHHLVLFDLPLNPDLLEQRIGRLDRIGQAETIQIHVPYLENSALAVMFAWYHQGLNAFEKTCPAGRTVFSQVEAELIAALHHRRADALTNLVAVTQSTNRVLNDALESGRDRLLEYHSFRPAVTEKLLETAYAEDRDTILPHYMEAVFDCCGVHIEEHRGGSFLLEPGEYMTIPFPGLMDEGSVITYSRNVALGNEDMYFLTWEHPMVMHAMDRITGQESGNAVVAAIKHPTVQPGTLLVESIFILETGGQEIRQSNYYLPPVAIRTLADEQDGNGYSALSHESINRHWVPVTAGIAKQVIQLKEDAIKAMLVSSERQAETQVPRLIADARHRIGKTLLPEIERLQALKAINPNVREEEIVFFEHQLKILNAALDSARLRLDAVRVIVAT